MMAVPAQAAARVVKILICGHLLKAALRRIDEGRLLTWEPYLFRQKTARPLEWAGFAFADLNVPARTPFEAVGR